MSGRPVHLVAAATIAAAASLFSISAASANCYSCGPSVVYQQPTVSYAAPVAYPAPVQYSPGCGCAAHAPMYVVNQGPAYTAPVPIEAEETPAYEPAYRRAYPYYSGGHMRWRHRHWYRGYGARGYGYRGYGYRDHGPRFGYRGFGYRGFGHRYGAVMPGARYSMRHPMVGPGGIYRGGMNMNRMHGPRPMVGPGGMHRAPQHAGGMRPGSVHPIGAPKQKMP
jgi:hypothetical protein